MPALGPESRTRNSKFKIQNSKADRSQIANLKSQIPKLLSLLLPVILALASGCTVQPLRLDPDATRYAAAWETPRLAQQPVLLAVTVVGNCDRDALAKAVQDVLVGSGKFRLAGGRDEPAYRLDVRVQVRRTTHAWKAVGGALILYVIPVRVAERVCEVFIDVKTPGGQLVAHAYTQGRARCSIWLGYALWPAWLDNAAAWDEVCGDTLRAAAVKTCDKIVPHPNRTEPRKENP